MLTIFYEGKTTIVPTPSQSLSTKKTETPKAVSNFPLPIITFPKSFDSNGVYSTAADIITIRGTVPNTTTSVEVNGFKLKRFTLGNTTFSYIANAAYGNMKKGLNTYKIITRGSNNESSEISIKINYTPLDLTK
jgi:hypothetical protein